MVVEGVKQQFLSEIPTTGPPTASQELDEEDFLNLLLTQMQNQDPLSPMESSQMMDQISSMNQVEQLQVANQNLETLIMGMASLNNATAVNLIDRAVMVAGDEFTAPETQVTLGFLVVGPADEVEVSVVDSAGEGDHSASFSAVEAGLEGFTFSGAIPGETYSLVVTATADGEEVPAYGAISGVVEGLDFSDGLVKLVVGDLRVGLDSVLQVLPGDEPDAVQDGVLPAGGPQPDPQKSLAALETLLRGLR